MIGAVSVLLTKLRLLGFDWCMHGSLQAWQTMTKSIVLVLDLISRLVFRKSVPLVPSLPCFYN